MVDGPKDRVIWYHRNERSIWADNLKLQALDELAAPSRDPLLHRTFGGEIRGDGMIRTGPTSLQSAGPARQCRISVYVYTGQTETPDVWRNEVNALAAKIEAQDRRRQREDHDRWWCDFWNRSGSRRRRRRRRGGHTGLCPPAVHQRVCRARRDADQVQRVPVHHRLHGRTARSSTPTSASGADPIGFRTRALPYWSMLAVRRFGSRCRRCSACTAIPCRWPSSEPGGISPRWRFLAGNDLFLGHVCERQLRIGSHKANRTA